MRNKSNDTQSGDTDLQSNDQTDDTQDIDTDSDETSETDKKVKDLEARLVRASQENKKYRQALSTLKAEKETEAAAKLKEEGKWKDMYEENQKKLDELTGKLRNTARSVAFRKEAVKQGADAELIELLEAKAKLSDIELDDSFRVNDEQVIHEVEQMKKKFSKLFEKQVRDPKGGPPKTTTTEKTDVVSEAKKAKTQAELDAVLKKYGQI